MDIFTVDQDATLQPPHPGRIRLDPAPDQLVGKALLLHRPGQVQALGIECDESKIEDSVAPCTGSIGDTCDYTCRPGYTKEGDHICYLDRVFRGGRCTPGRCIDGFTIEHSIDRRADCSDSDENCAPCQGPQGRPGREPREGESATWRRGRGPQRETSAQCCHAGDGRWDWFFDARDHGLVHAPSGLSSALLLLGLACLTTVNCETHGKG